MNKDELDILLVENSKLKEIITELKDELNTVTTDLNNIAMFLKPVARRIFERDCDLLARVAEFYNDNELIDKTPKEVFNIIRDLDTVLYCNLHDEKAYEMLNTEVRK